MRGEMKPAGAAQCWRRGRGVLVTDFTQGFVIPHNQPRCLKSGWYHRPLLLLPPERKQAARAGVAVLKFKSRETNHFCSQVAETTGRASPRDLVLSC